MSKWCVTLKVKQWIEAEDFNKAMEVADEKVKETAEALEDFAQTEVSIQDVSMDTEGE